MIRDGEVTFEPAGELWGKEIPETFDALQDAVRRQARRRRVGDRPGRRAAAADRVGDERPLSRVRPPGLRRDLRQQEPEGDRRVAAPARSRSRSPTRSRRSASGSPTSTSATSASSRGSSRTSAKPKSWLGWMYRADDAAWARSCSRRRRRCAGCGPQRGTTGGGRAVDRERRRADQELDGRRLARLPAREEGHEDRRRRRRQVHHEEAVVRRLPDAVQGHRQGEVAQPDRRPAAGLRDDRRVRREPAERRHRARHRVPRRVQPATASTR